MAPGIGRCAICTDSFSAPCVIPTCGHVFCLECVKAYLRSASGRQKKCPMCRQPMGNQYPIKLFIDDSGDNQPSGSPVNTSPFAESSTSWAAATIPMPLFATIHLNNLRTELASLQAEHNSMRSQFQTAMNEKRITERTLKELTAAQEQWEVQRESLLQECEAQCSATQERENEVHALAAEVQALREQIKLSSMNLGVIEPDSKDSRLSNVFRVDRVEQYDHISTMPGPRSTPAKSDSATDTDHHLLSWNLPPPILPSVPPENIETCEAQYTLPPQDTTPFSIKTSDAVDGAPATANLNYVYPRRRMRKTSRASGINVTGGVPRRQR